jgi:AmmeMemoRadiSam system protein B
MFTQHRLSSRIPAVAGQFYPGDRDELNEMLTAMLQQARPVTPKHIKALISPHAGYIYSGPVAATAYQALKNQAEQIKRVVLLGPSHRVGFHGIATSSASEYKMPLGSIPIDRAAVDLISDLPQVVEYDEAHQYEHSLEVQLPFLQRVLEDFVLVPLVVGDCPGEQVAEVLELLWGGEETLIVISSDLSHYNPYDVAREQDRRTSEAIVNLQPERIQYDDACGRNPVKGMLLAAKRHHLATDLVDLRNSGDTAGDKSRVVGYGAYLFTD